MMDLFSNAGVAAPPADRVRSAKPDQFPAVPGHARGSSTSKAAADSMKDHTSRLQQRVLDCISGGPKTAYEVEVATGHRACSITARMRELALAHKIQDTGERRVGPSGRSAKVWRVTGA
jgi:hypothetical protein